MSLIETRLNNFREQSPLDKNEVRPSRYGALDLFVTETDRPDSAISANLKQRALTSIGTDIEVPVIDADQDVKITNTREVIIPDDENTSKLYKMVFTTYAFGFTMIPTNYHNNEIDYQRDFNRKLEKYLVALGAKLDSQAIAALEANKTQVFADTLGYENVGNVLQSKHSQRKLVLGDMGIVMDNNDYFGDLHVVGNGGIQSLVRELAQSDIYNAENKRNEWADKIFHFTTRLANEEGNYGTFYTVEGGQVGVLTRFEREALRNAKSRTGHEWGISNLPILNIPCGTYYYESVGNQSAVAGAASADNTRAIKESYGFAVDIAFVTPYNSDPANIASPILATTIKEEGAQDAINVKMVE